MPNRGVFIVLEGADGSGKTTQFNLLAERLKAIGYEVAIFDFPRYEHNSSHFVKEYLNGKYGSASEVSPYTASLFFALDRYEAAKDIRKALEGGKIVLSNRYAGSNMAHQGSKFTDEAERRGFFVWADNLEFQLLGIPRPDINLFLRVPAEVSYELIKRKNARSYTDKVHDEHEADINHLKQSVATYDLLCQLFPKDFKAIECTAKDNLLGVAEINNLIWKALQPILPPEKPNPSHSVVVALSQPEETKPNEATQPGELSFKFKDPSLLLRLQLARLARTTPESAVEPWFRTNYVFYTPSEMPRQLSGTYKASMQKQAELQNELRRQLRQYLEKNLLQSANQPASSNLDELLLPLTPLSAISPFTVSLKHSEVRPLCSQLLASDTAEAQWAARQLYLAGRQKWPRDFKQPLETKSDFEPVSSLITKLAMDRLPQHNSDSEEVKLLESRPRQEFDLLAESIYPFSNLSLEEIVEEVANWPYTQKFESLKQAINVPGLLSKVSYKVDLISDQITLNHLARLTALKSLQTQALTPRYGYSLPTAIEDAGMEGLYDQCFDESLKLYSLLQSADQEVAAPYATLMGHRNRWQFTVTAEDFRQILAPLKIGSLGELIKNIYEKASEAHPLLWEIIAGQQAPTVRLHPTRSRVKPNHQRRQRPKKS